MYKACASVLSTNFISTHPFRLPPRKISAIWRLKLSGIFSLQNALLSTNFGSTGRLHYFAAINEV